ncbi:hypothetical protein HKD37_15G043302 [Glycine soja]
MITDFRERVNLRIAEEGCKKVETGKRSKTLNLRIASQTRVPLTSNLCPYQTLFEFQIFYLFSLLKRFVLTSIKFSINKPPETDTSTPPSPTPESAPTRSSPSSGSLTDGASNSQRTLNLLHSCYALSSSMPLRRRIATALLLSALRCRVASSLSSLVW